MLVGFSVHVLCTKYNTKGNVLTDILPMAYSFNRKVDNDYHY